MKKILIFEPNSNQALAISSYIKKYSDYYIIGIIENKIEFNYSNYDEIIVKDFMDIDISEYDYILPMGANSTFNIIAKYKKLIYENDIYFSYKNLIVFNKPKMLNIATKIGIHIPRTFYDIKDINSFPIFYKENFENGGGLRGIAKNKYEIPIYDSLIYQEYINTPATYSVGFLAKDGELITYIQHKESISYPKEGGSAVVMEKYNDKRLLLYTEKLIKKINYNGWGLAEFKYCNKRNDFVFMEINAKFWASIEFILLNNSDFLKYLLDIQYPKKNVNRLLFINRLCKYNFFGIVKNIPYMFNSRIMKESNLFYQILRQLIPQNIIDLIKKIFK